MVKNFFNVVFLPIALCIKFTAISFFNIQTCKMKLYVAVMKYANANRIKALPIFNK